MNYYDKKSITALVESDEGWIERRQFDNPYYSVLDQRDLLGSNDAGKEWRTNPENASSLFVLIDAYGEFQRADKWVLYGRRGTGKSAVLRYLRHTIRNGKHSKYNLCWLVASEYVQFALWRALNHVGTMDDSVVIRYISDVWIWVFEVSVIACVFHHVIHGRIALSPDDQATLEHLLDEMGINPSEEYWKFKIRLGDRIQDCAYSISPKTPGLAWRELLKLLRSEAHTKAFETVNRISTEYKLSSLILIDSPDTFQPYQSVIFSGLLAAIVETDEREYQHNYMVNATIPSEMVPYLSNQLHPDRLTDHELYVRWSYRTLLVFIARRFALFFGKGHADISDWKTAEGFLNAFLPTEVRSRNGLKLNTWSYIIRHTMKTPRQLLMLCNCILTIAERRGLSHSDLQLPEHDRLIRWGVHASLDKLLHSVTHISLQIDPDFSDIARNSLTLHNAYFTSSRFDKYLKGNERFNKGVFNTKDKQRMALINSGLVGLLRSVHTLRDGTLYFISSFEYQVKDILHPSNRDIFVAHPICYEHLRMRLRPEIVVYPYPYEDEEIEVLKQQGITLV